jgi:hypothetical protein
MKMKSDKNQIGEVHVSFERIWKQNIWSLLFFEEKTKVIRFAKN